jgi:hypothetical protein
VLQCSEDFFSLPMDEKMKDSQKKAVGIPARGYEVLGGQTMQSVVLPDTKEVSLHSISRAVLFSTEIMNSGANAGTWLLHRRRDVSG